jgi:hypothetical protein
MHRHSARIHVGQSSATLAAHARVRGTKVPIKAFILLGGDIEAFNLSAIHPVAYMGGPILHLKWPLPPATEIMVREEGMETKPTHFKCDLRDTKYRLMDSSTQCRLLATFASVIGPSQRVTFTGQICDETQTAHLARIMGPSTSCQVARWFNLLETFPRAKTLADEAFEKDNLGFVLTLYTRIVDAVLELLASNEVRVWVLHHCPQTAIDMLTMCLELAVNVGCGSVKLKLFDSCSQALGCLILVLKHAG